MSDPAWGFTYVLHGLAGVGFVGLIIAHIYFALRPEKLWITKSMIFGYITRRAVSRASRSRSLANRVALAHRSSTPPSPTVGAEGTGGVEASPLCAFDFSYRPQP